MKTFREGEMLEFIRDAQRKGTWEAGTYHHAWRAPLSGWHWVKSVQAGKFLVPTRRIRKVEK